MRKERFLYAVGLGAALLWSLAIIAAPLFVASSGFLQTLSDFLYQFFGRICHQFDERSFHLDGEKFAVCARCSSIYLGFFFGLLTMPLIRNFPALSVPHRWVLFAAVVPMLLDVGLALLNLYESTLWTRALSGGVFGIVVSHFILPGFLSAFCSQIPSDTKCHKVSQRDHFAPFHGASWVAGRPLRGVTTPNGICCSGECIGGSNAPKT